ncbi:hypothetical protein DSO57_1037894 [Entomophthora muscae]|uniref:Uncharacterized protein n=1 Tax=Entomophthora muscae TaxID=34485 RepID=A0ACC2RPP6_9FUNG|nr:hypothetical protein DSO57_1037894 [Entomophthora muscae]
MTTFVSNHKFLAGLLKYIILHLIGQDLTPPKKPSPEKSPAHSTGGEETDGSLTDHSFYNLASDEEPTKKQCQAKKIPTKDKSPEHEEHQDKPPSSSPPPPNSPFKFIWDNTKPHPNYFPGFHHAPAGPWDPLLAHNICNVDGKFKVPSALPKYFPIMSIKGWAGHGGQWLNFLL